MSKTVLLLTTLLQLQVTHTFNSQSRLEFAWNFFNTITLFQPYENFIVSPVSVQTCLAMTYMGAEGQTAAEMRQVLALEQFARKEDVAYDFGEFIQANIKSAQSKLEMANRIYVDRRFHVLPAYNELISSYFQSTVASVDFSKNIQTAQGINEWVKRQTHGKIQGLMQPTELTSDTGIVLVNAIYFKAEWLYPFDARYTIPRDFHLNSLVTKQVPMMYRTNMKIRYSEVPALQLVAAEFLYKDTDLRMLILMPNQLDGGVTTLEQTLSASVMQQVQQSLREVQMDVVMPKFRIEFDLNLVEPLKVMGLSLLFYDAELPNMVTGAIGPLYVSEVKHKAHISVDEKGSEATGATYTQILEKSGRFFEPNLKVDRPFVFAILDDKAVYFIGHVLKL
ncbi:serine protease inhibitor 42Dd-like [Anastrepha obliqua]|uniref:serine protease inhibitor 42Dd-like n=1 Tax=Anastrepha obliqua TaxID=95512 RepID=UPI00240A75FC|nr:serine protease inhibitor 42Dd-like [Anastrepha obliqua]